MSISRNSSAHTVRPRPRWQVPKVLCVLVFAVTGAVVHWWGLAEAKRTQPVRSYTSAAMIYQQSGFPFTDTVGEASSAILPDLKKIEQQITSEANMQRAVRRLGYAVKPLRAKHPKTTARRPPVEELLENVRVAAAWTATPGELGISLTYTSHDADYVARLVNGLAESYAQDCRGTWKARAHRAYRDVQQASDRAQREYLKANARVDLFIEQHFKAGEPAAEQAASVPAEHAPPPPAGQAARMPAPELGGHRVIAGADTALPSAGVGSESLAMTQPWSSAPATTSQPPLTDNPQWIELAQRLAELRRRRAELRRRRAELLDDRTPEHPVVRYNEIQIAELGDRITKLERQIEPVPRKIRGQRTDLAKPGGQTTDAQTPPPSAHHLPDENPPAWPPARVTAGPTARQYAENVERLRQLKAAADQAGEVYDRATRAEHQAWQVYQREPQIELELARPHEASPAQRAGLGPLLTALAAGVAAAAGVGMISTGAAMEPTVNTLAQAQAALPVPIVGTVPPTDPASEPKVAGRWQPLIRPTMILGGLVLIAGCAAMLIMTLGGS